MNHSVKKKKGPGEVWTSKSWVFCRRLNWLHQWVARTEESCDYAEWPLFAPSDGGTSRPAGKSEVLVLSPVVWPVFGGRWVQFRRRPWRPAPSSKIGCGCNRKPAEVTWENFGRLKARRAAAFWVRFCNGFVAKAGGPTKSELQSRQEMTSAWTRSWTDFPAQTSNFSMDCECCAVGNWTCVRFLRIFHLSIKRLLQFSSQTLSSCTL